MENVSERILDRNYYVILFSLADTPFTQLKLSEIGSWIGRRNKTPNAMVGAISRGKFHKFFDR